MDNVCINITSVDSISTDKIATKKKEEQKYYL